MFLMLNRCEGKNNCVPPPLPTSSLHKGLLIAEWQQLEKTVKEVSEEPSGPQGPCLYLVMFSHA